MVINFLKNVELIGEGVKSVGPIEPSQFHNSA